MITTLILLILALIIALIVAGVAGMLAWNSVKRNFELQDRQKDYNRFHTLMLDTLEADTQFMKTDLIKRLSLELPETRGINSSIIQFQSRLELIKNTLKEYKMLED